MSGLLIYDAGGNMSADVMRNDRPLFAANDPGRGTDAEVRAAFDGHASYFGTYTIAGAVHASARIRWPIIGVRSELGTHLVRAKAEVRIMMEDEEHDVRDQSRG